MHGFRPGQILAGENHLLVCPEPDDISDKPTNSAPSGAITLQLTQVKVTLRKRGNERMIAASALGGISHRDKCKD